MEHSKNFAKVRDYYNAKLWNEKRCRDAVVKKWITPEEFEEITGVSYY